MKKIYSFFIIFFSLFLGASVQAADFSIESFNADITISQDASFEVKETIVADFTEERHGLFRSIPVSYKKENGGRLKINVDVESVRDENLRAIPYETYREGSNLVVKIGDPDSFVFGQQIYIINYKVMGAILYLEDHDELYWNVTGTEWPVSIPQSSASVKIDNYSITSPQTDCYTGYLGSSVQNCTIKQVGNRTDYAANDYLTIVYGFPKGVIVAPSELSKFWSFVLYNLGYLIAVATLVFMYRLWNKKGRDPKGRGVIRQYDSPDDLSPAEMGMLIGSFNPKLISAEIVYLASKGYIHIKEVKNKVWGIKTYTDYELTKKKDYAHSSELKKHQIRLMHEIFENGDTQKISDLSKDFYKSIQLVKKNIEEQLQDKHYYDEHPAKTKSKYVGAGIVITFMSVWLFGGFLSDVGVPPSYAVGLILSGIIITVFSVIMPRLTEAGVAAKEHALGFRIYIDQAETARIKWEEKVNLFFQFMPYAMAFGLAKKWAAAFKDLSQHAPEWYQSADGNFSPIIFAGNLSSFSTATSTHFTATAPSSSGGGGGGFSGGGFGGGGGGSW